MPEEAPGFMQCGTKWAGWMRGQHPGTMFIIHNHKLIEIGFLRFQKKIQLISPKLLNIDFILLRTINDFKLSFSINHFTPWEMTISFWAKWAQKLNACTKPFII